MRCVPQKNDKLTVVEERLESTIKRFFKSIKSWSAHKKYQYGRIYKLGEGRVLEILSTDYTDWTDFFEEK